jgi:hypothetical protein
MARCVCIAPSPCSVPDTTRHPGTASRSASPSSRWRRWSSARSGRWPTQHYIPSATGMAISFLLVPAVFIDMCMGSLTLYLWSMMDRETALVFASGLFSIPHVLRAAHGVTPPISVRFLGREQNSSLDAFLKNRTAAQ